MKKKKDAVCIALILALYTVLAIAGIGCPIKFMTGISCPGCGMTRAWLSVLHIDFGSAFAFHPLFWILPVVFLIIFFREKINRKLYNVTIGICIALLAAVYIFRMFDADNTVVTFGIANGAVCRIIKFIAGGIKSW